MIIAGVETGLLDPEKMEGEEDVYSLSVFGLPVRSTY